MAPLSRNIAFLKLWRSSMLRSVKSGIILAATLAVAPVGLSTYGLVEKNASAVATYRPGAMKPGSTRGYTAGGERPD